MKTKEELIHWLDQNSTDFIQIANKIWENPEDSLKEFEASKLQASFLENQGFSIRWGSGGLDTAFIAGFGQGRPIIGFLGEYDALKNLSQKNQPTKEPITSGGLGHGCGHNLLGTGAVASVVALKNWLEMNGIQGTIRYYGCPAEETLIGKVYMARDGVFSDLDAAFNFHPSYINSASKGSMVALNSIKFHFYGKASHAGASPHLGRSALDAVELMNVGVNYLREHVETSSRIHYVITHGGDVPNIVPPEAEVWYFIRAPRREQVHAITERIRRVALGATLMTDTTVDETFITGCYNLLNNHYLSDLQYQAMKIIGPIPFTEEEYAFANQINDGYPQETRASIFKGLHLPSNLEGNSLFPENYPAADEDEIDTGSTDVADVSWLTPLSMLGTACWASGASGHSWGIVASSGMSIGHKGMMHAAKVMAVAAMDLYTDPRHIQKAREEFENSTLDQAYKSPLVD